MEVSQAKELQCSLKVWEFGGWEVGDMHQRKKTMCSEEDGGAVTGGRELIVETKV